MKYCKWCGALLMGHEVLSETCNDCLSGKSVCEGCGEPLKDHEDGCPSHELQAYRRRLACQRV